MSPESIIIAVSIPVILCALVVIVSLAQMDRQNRKDRAFWAKRNAEWRDCDVQRYHDELKGGK